jgi:predicted small metal-binding protein
MSKVLSCRDVGVDCDFIARGETEEEIFRLCAEHGRKAHNMKSIPEDLRTKMRQYIRDESSL